MAKRYSDKKTKSKRKSPKRVAAGKKAARTRKRNAAAKKGSVRGLTARWSAVCGSWQSHKPVKRGGKKKAKRGGHKLGIGYCSTGNCSRRPIFGGAKGLATHKRRHHRG